MSTNVLPSSYLTIMATSLFLFGCNENDTVSSLQNQPFSYINSLNEIMQYEPSFTIGQAFNNRQICEGVTWDSFEDNRGRTIVQYQCEFKQLAKTVNMSIEENKSKEIARVTTLHNQLTDKINRLGSKESLEQQLAEAEKIEHIIDKAMTASNIRRKLDQLNGLTRNLNRNFPQGFKTTIQEINNKYSNLISPVTVSEIYQWSVSPNKTYIFAYNGFQTKMSDNSFIDCQIELSDSLKLIYQDTNNVQSYNKLIKTLTHWTERTNDLGINDVIYFNDLKCQRQ